MYKLTCSFQIEVCNTKQVAAYSSSKEDLFPHILRTPFPSLQEKRVLQFLSENPIDSQGSSPTLQFKSINSSVLSFLYSPTRTSIHDYWKNHSLTRWTFVGKVMSLLFNNLSRLVITFLPRSKRILIS